MNVNHKEEKIIIRGNVYYKELFSSPCDVNEIDLKGILNHILDIGLIARKGYKDIDSLVKNSPLLYLEGVLRFQFEKHDTDGIGLERLETRSDFIHEYDYIHDVIGCNKLVFLFDFLSDIVFLADSPEFITDSEIDKISHNLQKLSFLCTPQITGKMAHTEDNTIIFNRLAFYVWLQNGSTKMIAKVFWSKTITLLLENDGEIELGYDKSEEKEPYVFILDPAPSQENEKNEDSYTIKCYRSNIGKTCDLKIGHRTAKKRWPTIQKEIIEAMNKEK